MKRDIVHVKNPVLRNKSKPVKKIDKKIKKLIRDMKETLRVQKDPEGVGLAASQVGVNLQIFAIKPDKKVTVFINPKLISKSKDKNMTGREKNKIMEGCLSLPHYYGPLRRAEEITIEYLTEEGNIKQEIFTGLEAQIIQHELDHLEGVLFIDRLLEQKTPLYEQIGDEWEEVDLIM